jgi:hypothetical protein
VPALPRLVFCSGAPRFPVSATPSAGSTLQAARSSSEIFVQAAEAVDDFRTALRVTGGLFIPPASDANMLPSKPEQTHGTVNTVD